MNKPVVFDNDDAGYISWLEHHEHGFVRPKACSDDREMLERWAREQCYAFQLCSNCGL
jgi:hypothetical protein